MMPAADKAYQATFRNSSPPAAPTDLFSAEAYALEHPPDGARLIGRLRKIHENVRSTTRRLRITFGAWGSFRVNRFVNTFKASSVG
jgi:hypothetical protein